jgi:putative transposase
VVANRQADRLRDLLAAGVVAAVDAGAIGSRKINHSAGLIVLYPPRFSLRLKNFDYSQSRLYFLTTCAHERLPLFGEIKNGKSTPTAIGLIVSESWFELPYHYARLELGSFALMPNHVHGLIALHDPVGAGLRPARGSDAVSEIVRAFKSFSSKRIHAEIAGFAKMQIWQRGFYDRIVRNREEYEKIRRYIRRNPERWEYDKENARRQRDSLIEDWDS